MRKLFALILGIVNILNVYCQTLNEEELFKYESIFQQKNIRISERIKDEWKLSDSFIQLIYYNANLDSTIDSIQNITKVLSIYGYDPLDGYIFMELQDDGKHFDKVEKDGIYANINIGDFLSFRTDELNIVIQINDVEIGYNALFNEVDYIPPVPVIIYPKNNSSILPGAEISWTIDYNADGCEIILLKGLPNFGELFENILLTKRIGNNSEHFYSEKLPFFEDASQDYTLLICSYTNTKYKHDHWDRGSYSLEWVRFYIDSSQKIQTVTLSQNYPNPLNNETIIQYKLPSEGVVTITIYDILGNEIAHLVNENKSQGEYYTIWKGKNDFGKKVSSGIYLYSIIFNEHSITKKMILSR